MYLTTRALVLRVTDYNDRDSLLTLLTPQWKNHSQGPGPAAEKQPADSALPAAVLR